MKLIDVRDARGNNLLRIYCHGPRQHARVFVVPKSDVQIIAGFDKGIMHARPYPIVQMLDLPATASAQVL